MGAYVVRIEAGGGVFFPSGDVHRCAVDDVVLVDRIGYDTGVRELGDLAAGLDDERAVSGVNLGIGAGYEGYPTDF